MSDAANLRCTNDNWKRSENKEMSLIMDAIRSMTATIIALITKAMINA